MYSYGYKFYLYAQHSVSIDGQSGAAHPHTWSFTAYLEASKNFAKYSEVEHIIQEVISPYQNSYLNEKEPFDVLNPTMENVGEVFFLKIAEVLKPRDIKLLGMEVSETPVRTYIVDPTMLTTRDAKAKLSGFLQGVMQYAEDTLAEKVQIFDNKKQAEAPDLAEEQDQPGQPYPDPHEDDQWVEPQEPKHYVTDLPGGRGRMGLCKIPLWLSVMLALLAIGGSTAFLLWYVNRTGNYPWGSDSYGHIFKADLLYRSMQAGNFFPNYTELWYNGIQPFRYWAPIPYYILAIFQFFTNGDSIAAYNVFIAFSFVFGALGWLLWGVREKRIILSAVLGILWFSMPDNIRVFFSEGNLPRVLIAVLLPYLFFFLWQFVEHKRKQAIIGVILLTTVLCLSHLMITAMVGITVFMFLLYYAIANRSYTKPVQVLVAMLLGISLSGFWLYPALQGGLMSMNSEAVSEVMKDLTFPFAQTLNPLLRLHNVELFYFGLSFVVIAFLALFLSNRKSLPGFLTLVTVFLGTTTAFVPFLLQLPFNQLLWMMRFTPVAYATFVIGILMWKNLRRSATVLLVGILILDSMVSFRLLAHNTNPSEELKKTLDEAIQITQQRVALLDGSEFGSLPSYYLTTGDKPVSCAYGWAWQGAQTAENIVLLNTALEKKHYIFLFDRSLEAGCDTVIVKKDKVKERYQLDAAAQKSNYSLVKETSYAYIYHIETPERFGLKTQYDGIAIGKSAANIVVEFASIEIGASNYLDDYTLDELLQYKVVYLSDFDYRDQKAAEQLVLDAAQQGVYFVIDMNRVPYVAVTNRMTFLGVTAQPIQFENKLPSLHFRGITYFPITFKEENRVWNTIYLENVPNPRGFSWFGGNKLVFIGEHTNPNITFVGFNLLYHGIANQDTQVIDMFGTVIGMLKDSVPQREIVPIDIRVDDNHITINTPGGDINTTLADLDAFETSEGTHSVHNLLHVTEQTTEINVSYPYWKEGLAVSAIGLIACALFLYQVLKSKGDKHDKTKKSDLDSVADGHPTDRVLT